MVKLKFRYRDLFRRGRLVFRLLYEQLEDLQSQIDSIGGIDEETLSKLDALENFAPVTVKENVDLTAQALGSNFGAANKFTGVGVVSNASGTYIVVSDGSAYKYITLDDLS